MTEPEPRLTTGEFARRTRLSPKALRVYDRTGLLSPATIDPDNGYRRDGPEQVRVGQLIGLLRAAELGLDEIRGVLDELGRGTAHAVGIRSEPAHDEAFTTITRAQWAYPAILAAYDAVACSPQVRARPGSRLSCREVYLAQPGDVTDAQPLCDIAYPLGERP